MDPNGAGDVLLTVMGCICAYGDCWSFRKGLAMGSLIRLVQLVSVVHLGGTGCSGGRSSSSSRITHVLAGCWGLFINF